MDNFDIKDAIGFGADTTNVTFGEQGEKVQEVIKPIYKDLSRDDLLTRCLGAKTQNNNESPPVVNSLIWTFASKHLHSGAKVVETTKFLAVLFLNEGFESILKLMEVTGAKIGLNSQEFANKRDDSRIDRSERRLSNFARQARISNREEKTALREFFEEEESQKPIHP
ncbi:unnamed protein product [Euphydryas editha]|uniref:Uncharacterized protein n=1 Tax=Euphydryas editha TaxID=104508 RepID=A0AAU9TP38_EUPED|nr:unnamed protein product [Euphydryas editha]